MKTLAALGTAFLLLLLTASVPRLKAQEQENDRNGAKSEQPQDENKQPAAKPRQDENKQPAAKPRQDENKQPTARPQEDRSHEQSKQEPSKQEPKANRPDQERSNQEGARQPQAAPPQHQERTPVETQRNDSRPAEAQRGQRIPDDRFRASFGSRHTFHLRRDEVINNPRPVIAYGGYSFELLEPWPAGWSFDDGCYIDYLDDQYYLIDPVHPGVSIALVVVNAD